jgi:hypothetical protein
LRRARSNPDIRPEEPASNILDVVSRTSVINIENDRDILYPSAGQWPAADFQTSVRHLPLRRMLARRALVGLRFR